MRILLEILLFDELNDDIFVRLNLQHFAHQAKKRSWFNIAAIYTTDIFQFCRFVHQQFSCNKKTFDGIIKRYMNQ